MKSWQHTFEDLVRSALKASGAQAIEDIHHDNGYSCGFSLHKNGRTWHLKLLTVGWALEELPRIFWLRTTPVWGYMHVGHDGDICVSDREGLEYDPDDVSGVIAWLLDEAVKILESNQVPSSQRHSSFADELEAYLTNAGAPKISTDGDGDCSRPLYAEVRKTRNGESGPWKLVVHRVGHGTKKTDRSQLVRVAIVDVSIHQIEGLISEWSTDWWDSFLTRISPCKRKVVSDKKNQGVILRLPTSFGHAQVLLLSGNSWAADERTYVLQRADHKYIVQRTGGEPINQHVVIAGCGSVGSRVAEHLALSGIRKLTLVDHDKFSADNLGRHVLGLESVNKYKVFELAKLLRDRMPEIEVSPRAVGFQFLTGEAEVRSADVIILATGKSALERSVIRQAFKENWPSLIVSTSVEAAGLGGHAIAMRPGIPGCLDCLYTDPETQQPSPNMRTALLEPGQTVTRQLTGCGAFTPYSSIDATRTALLAVEMVLGNRPMYSRWAGQPERAEKEGLKPSQTHEALQKGLVPAEVQPDKYAQPGCLCCSV